MSGFRTVAYLRRALSHYHQAFDHRLTRSCSTGPTRKQDFAVRVVETCQLSDAQGTYATATVTFQTNLPVAAIAAVKTVLGRLHKLLPGPTFLFMYTSLPREAAKAAVGRIMQELRAGGAVQPALLAGCTTSRWRPEGEASIAPAGPVSSTEAPPPPSHHITLAAAKLPGMKAMSFHTNNDTIPVLPSEEMEALLGSRPPHFLLLTHPIEHRSSSLGYAMLKRLENVFPGSAMAGTVAGWMEKAAWAGASGTAAGVSGGMRPRGRKRKGTAASTAEGAPSAVNLEDSSSRQRSSSLLFLGDQVLDNGTVGIMLYPQHPEGGFAPPSALNLVRMLLGGERFGGDPYESPRYVLPAPLRSLLHPQTTASPSSLPLPPATSWAPAVVTPPGMTGTVGKHSSRQSDKELPMLALPRTVLWPDQEVMLPLPVTEPRHLLLLRACLETRTALGIAGEGVGTTARVTGLHQGTSGEVVVTLVGGRRFEYLPGNPRVHTPGAARVLPGCFGLTAATVHYLEDRKVEGTERERVVALAQEACGLVLRGVQELAASWRRAQQGASSPSSFPARPHLLFTNALHIQAAAPIEATDCSDAPAHDGPGTAADHDVVGAGADHDGPGAGGAEPAAGATMGAGDPNGPAFLSVEASASTSPSPSLAMDEPASTSSSLAFPLHADERGSRMASHARSLDGRHEAHSGARGRGQTGGQHLGHGEGSSSSSSSGSSQSNAAASDVETGSWLGYHLGGASDRSHCSTSTGGGTSSMTSAGSGSRGGDVCTSRSSRGGEGTIGDGASARVRLAEVVYSTSHGSCSAGGADGGDTWAGSSCSDSNGGGDSSCAGDGYSSSESSLSGAGSSGGSSSSSRSISGGASNAGGGGGSSSGGSSTSSSSGVASSAGGGGSTSGGSLSGSSGTNGKFGGGVAGRGKKGGGSGEHGRPRDARDSRERVVQDVLGTARRAVLKQMDAGAAQQVSLWLGGVMTDVGCPTSRAWLRQCSTLQRLEQQVQVLKQFECRCDVAAALAKQSFNHPLKRLLMLY